MPKPDNLETSKEILMLGYLCIKGVEEFSEQLKILDRFEFSDSDISKICGAAKQTIRNVRVKNSKKFR